MRMWTEDGPPSQPFWTAMIFLPHPARNYRSNNQAARTFSYVARASRRIDFGCITNDLHSPDRIGYLDVPICGWLRLCKVADMHRNNSSIAISMMNILRHKLQSHNAQQLEALQDL